MKRRDFVVLSIAAAACSRQAKAQAQAQQSTSVRRIGLLSPFSPADTKRWEEALRQGLVQFGWVDGRNLAIEYRYAGGRADRLPGLASELVGQKVEVIVTNVTADTLAARDATSEIPIVMVAVGDPVATGLVKSLARPGVKITGLSQMTTDLSGKRLELLKEVVPGVSTVGVLYNPEDRLAVLDWQEASHSAQRLGIQVRSVELRHSDGLKTALNEIIALRVGALALIPAPVLFENVKPIADFALQNQLPSTFHLREFATAGGLMSYGVDRSDLFRRAASYIDKILRGANAADLPIEQPTKFELVINMKTAKALNLVIPPRVLGVADEVIE